MTRHRLIRKVSALAILAMSFAPVSAMAQANTRALQVRACASDVSSYCQEQMSASEAEVGQCLLQNRSKVSPVCKRALRPSTL